MKRILWCWMVGLLVAGLLCPQAARGQAVVREIGSRLELFTDGWLIATMQNVERRLHPPVPREVVFTYDAPWEGPESAYVTLFQDGDLYRMYYRGGGENSEEYAAMAQSTDGIHWERPRLGLFEHEGSKDNNIIWSGPERAYWDCHNFSPFKDANPQAPPEERYKAVTLSRSDVDGDGENEKVLDGFVSPDGIHWRPLREEPLISKGSGFDSHNVAFWNPLLGQYECYSRIGIRGVRSIQRCLSKDFLTWTEPEPLDYGDAPVEQFYTNAILPYFRAPHLYLGFPMRFVPERKTVGRPPRQVDALSDAVFMSSRDGRHWDRSFMEAFIRPGLDPRNWGDGHGNQTPAWGLLATSPEEISIYWLEHYGYSGKPFSPPRLRRGTLRTDGFVSVQAPYEGGEFVTQPLRFEGTSLVINFSTSAVGGIKVELQDQQGRPVPGFELDSADEIYGDELARPVTWQGRTDVSALAGKPVRLRFGMKDADLYSIRFVP